MYLLVIEIKIETLDSYVTVIYIFVGYAQTSLSKAISNEHIKLSFPIKVDRHQLQTCRGAGCCKYVMKVFFSDIREAGNSVNVCRHIHA